MNDMYAMLALMQYENSNVDSTNQSNAFDSATLNKNELDVHGCSHEEVANEIENLLIMQYNTGNWPLTVVTGNSQKMKSLVIKHASRRGFNTKLPVNNNPGSIVVF
jgi:spore cortex formation protein SpoVR/YcgB (stage V sporulation)|tara:strand:+ start:258 stop:575 length:318 start_codon:yes stop_codon:yes gene_type:complete